MGVGRGEEQGCSASHLWPKSSSSHCLLSLNLFYSTVAPYFDILTDIFLIPGSSFTPYLKSNTMKHRLPCGRAVTVEKAFWVRQAQTLKISEHRQLGRPVGITSGTKYSLRGLEDQERKSEERVQGPPLIHTTWYEKSRGRGTCVQPNRAQGGFKIP